MVSFDRSKFFPLNKILYPEEILNIYGEYINKSSINNNFQISEISSLNKLRENSILFLSKEKKFNNNFSNNILIITDSSEIYDDLGTNKFFVKNLDLLYLKILNDLYNHEDDKFFDRDYDVNQGSYISKFSEIHDSTKIGFNCFIGRGVKIGKNCIIKNNVIIKNSILSNNIIIGDNTVIGSTGFGFNLQMRGSSNMLPHIGIVYISDNVRIGSSCTIDRAKIDITYIGSNSMIDNLCHIAHNVIIEESACIAAQCGISGSTSIGKNLICGGQVGFAGHINIGDNVIIAAKSGVTKNIPSNSTIAGFPAIDIKEWKRKIILEKKNGYK